MTREDALAVALAVARAELLAERAALARANETIAAMLADYPGERAATTQERNAA